MSTFQQVIIIGRLGKDPETRNFDNGGSVTNFTVATSETWKDKHSGEKKESTEWHNCSAFGKTGEIVAKYARKGDMINVIGKLKTRSYDKDGQTRYVTEIKVDGVTLLGGKSSGSSEPAAVASSAAVNDDLPF